MTAAHAEAILDRIRGHMNANKLGGFFSRDEMAAVLHLLDHARAERDRLAGQAQRVRAVCAGGVVIVYAHDVLRALGSEVPL